MSTGKINETFMTIEEVDLDVHFYYYSGLPGKTDDIPEKCYPEEYPEVDIEKVLISGTDIDISSLLSEKIMDKIETKILETADSEYD
jgi:hypothetical protein